MRRQVVALVLLALAACTDPTAPPPKTMTVPTRVVTDPMLETR